jgi:hypothetical protein
VLLNLIKRDAAGERRAELSSEPYGCSLMAVETPESLNLTPDTGTAQSPPAPMVLALNRWQIPFLAALGGALLSKLGALLPGFSPDDYYYAFGNTIKLQGIAQGRALADGLMYGMRWLGLTYADVQTPAFLLSLVALSGFIATVLDRTLRQGSSLGSGACAATFAAAYPYLSVNSTTKCNT